MRSSFGHPIVIGGPAGMVHVGQHPPPEHMPQNPEQMQGIAEGGDDMEEHSGDQADDDS
jgi:hypothetical protein